MFGIDLMASRSHAGYDGVFCAPPLAGRTVNIKTYSRNEWILDIGKHPCDYYLVLTGRPDRPESGRGSSSRSICSTHAG